MIGDSETGGKGGGVGALGGKAVDDRLARIEDQVSHSCLCNPFSKLKKEYIYKEYSHMTHCFTQIFVTEYLLPFGCMKSF